MVTLCSIYIVQRSHGALSILPSDHSVVLSVHTVHYLGTLSRPLYLIWKTPLFNSSLGALCHLDSSFVRRLFNSSFGALSRLDGNFVRRLFNSSLHWGLYLIWTAALFNSPLRCFLHLSLAQFTFPTSWFDRLHPTRQLCSTLLSSCDTVNKDSFNRCGYQ
jgi:hypothetical protein